MTPGQAAYRAGCLFSEAENRYARDGHFSPATYCNVARHPALMPVYLRHVWPEVVADPDLGPLLDWLGEANKGPATPGDQSAFAIGYYHQRTARQLPPTFPAKLTALRETAGLSVSQLAERAGTTRQTVHQYENGERRPTWDLVQKLAAALGVPTDTFRDR